MQREALLKLLGSVRSRGEIKRLGADAERDPALRAALVALAVSQGEDPEEAEALSGKRLVRLALDRADSAQVRRNPIHRDEAFTCTWCGAAVTPGGTPVRDHCARCLRSLHVDIVPGDRANPCRGVLHPARFAVEEGGQIGIHYRCGTCGAEHRNRAHPDDQIPPSLSPADLPGRPPVEKTLEPVRTLQVRVLEHIRRHRLWSPGDRVLVAVSGGVDSTVLLEILARTAPAHGARLAVVSLDHGFRPASADEVAAVGRHAAALDLPFASARLDIPPGPNLYARARDARRAALLAHDADRIATGHHRTDQAETVLHHLLRGAGARGLRGMAPLAAPWCRPLLEEPREHILAWARQEGLSWVEDPSNAASMRGSLRTLMPQLDAIQGGAEAALARAGRLLAREDDLLEDLTAAAWLRLAVDGAGLDLAGLRQEHPALQLRLLRHLTAPCPRPVRADQLEAFLDWTPQEGGALPLPADWCLRVRGGMLTAGPA